MPDTPEQLARIQIDAQLSAAGWTVQNISDLNLSASRGVAVREIQSHGGPADYILFVDGKALGIVEAKKEGTTLSYVAEQQQIVAEVEARTTAIDHLEAELDRQITRSNRLRQATLSEAFCGKL